MSCEVVMLLAYTCRLGVLSAICDRQESSCLGADNTVHLYSACSQLCHPCVLLAALPAVPKTSASTHGCVKAAVKAVTVLHRKTILDLPGCLGQSHVTADVLDFCNLNYLSLRIPSGLLTFRHVELGMASSWLGHWMPWLLDKNVKVPQAHDMDRYRSCHSVQHQDTTAIAQVPRPKIACMEPPELKWCAHHDIMS